MSIIGDRIREKRIEANMTLEELGKILGLSKSAINKWEKGVVLDIPLSSIKRMAELFNVPIVWLIGEENRECEATKRAALCTAALKVKPENLDNAIKLLELMS